MQSYLIESSTTLNDIQTKISKKCKSVKLQGAITTQQVAKLPNHIDCLFITRDVPAQALTIIPDNIRLIYFCEGCSPAILHSMKIKHRVDAFFKDNTNASFLKAMHSDKIHDAFVGISEETVANRSFKQLTFRISINTTTEQMLEFPNYRDIVIISMGATPDIVSHIPIGIPKVIIHPGVTHETIAAIPAAISNVTHLIQVGTELYETPCTVNRGSSIGFLSASSSSHGSDEQKKKNRDRKHSLESYHSGKRQRMLSPIPEEQKDCDKIEEDYDKKEEAAATLLSLKYS